MSTEQTPWPYPDLRLCSPQCPVCGEDAQLLVGPKLHPSAWCVNDDCQAFYWDPSRTALEVLWPLFTGEERLRSWQDLAAELVRRGEER